jgi:hypothetical protein
MRDPAEQLLRGLHDQAALASQISSTQDRERIISERRNHVRKVRSVARSRNRTPTQPANRPRSRLAWLVVLALVLLILAASRAAAARTPGVRYADALMGQPPCSSEADREASDEEAASDDVDDDDDDDDDNDDRCHGPAEATEGAELGADVSRPRPGAIDGGDPIGADASDPDGLVPGQGDWIEDGDLLPHVDIETGVTFASTAFSDAAELRDVQLRHHRPSRWGRVDFEIAWRRTWDLTPMKSTRDDTLWLVATWSR